MFDNLLMSLYIYCMDKKTRVIFLDRDGVINRKLENDYVKKWSEFQFLPRVINALQLLVNNEFKIFIITNQRGIALGLMTRDDLDHIHNRMQREFEKISISISGIYYCPNDYKDNCNCRKPNPGLLLQAAFEHNINFKEAILVGDSISDMEAGKCMGCKTFLVNQERDLLEIVEEEILRSYA